jgi:hypothetical protein
MNQYVMNNRMTRLFKINEGCIAHQQERLQLANEELAAEKARTALYQQKLDQSASLGIKYKDILKDSQQRLIKYVTDEAARHEEQESDE